MTDARWNQAGLYIPKMYKYQQLMRYSPKFVEQMKRFMKFQVVFVPYVQTSGFSADAQVNDLEFRREMERFKDVDLEVAEAVLKTWNGHLQFLAPEYCFLTLVSDKVTPAEKKKISEAILSTPRPEVLPPAPLKPAVTIDDKTKLPQLAKGPRTYLPFLLLNLDSSFLNLHPNEWFSDESFQRLQRFTKNFRVVNDVAEHAVQLATDYNELITRNEEQRQFLYVTVNKQRQDRADLRRKTLQPEQVKESPLAIDRSHLKRGGE